MELCGLEELLQECKLQLEYLNKKFRETGTTNALISKIGGACLDNENSLRSRIIDEIIAKINELKSFAGKMSMGEWSPTIVKLLEDYKSNEAEVLEVGDISSSLHIEFGIWLTGHDKKTIEQMFNNWNKINLTI